MLLTIICFCFIFLIYWQVDKNENILMKVSFRPLKLNNLNSITVSEIKYNTITSILYCYGCNIRLEN